MNPELPVWTGCFLHCWIHNGSAWWTECLHKEQQQQQRCSPLCRCSLVKANRFISHKGRRSTNETSHYWKQSPIRFKGFNPIKGSNDEEVTLIPAERIRSIRSRRNTDCRSCNATAEKLQDKSWCPPGAAAASGQSRSVLLQQHEPKTHPTWQPAARSLTWTLLASAFALPALRLVGSPNLRPGQQQHQQPGGRQAPDCPARAPAAPPRARQHHGGDPKPAVRSVRFGVIPEETRLSWRRVPQRRSSKRGREAAERRSGLRRSRSDDSCGIPGSGSLRGGPVRQQHPQSEPPPLKLRVSHSGSDVTPAQTRKPPGRSGCASAARQGGGEGRDAARRAKRQLRPQQRDPDWRRGGGGRAGEAGWSRERMQHSHTPLHAHAHTLHTQPTNCCKPEKKKKKAETAEGQSSTSWRFIYWFSSRNLKKYNKK